MRAILAGPDRKLRCFWAGSAPDYVRYHDEEWGLPTADDVRLFEKVCLEGFQSGLSWLTILRKREAFRRAFAGFDFEKVARFGARDVTRLLGDAGIVRHRGKIESTINNARRACELEQETGSLSAWLWSTSIRAGSTRWPSHATKPGCGFPACGRFSPQANHSSWSCLRPIC